VLVLLDLTMPVMDGEEAFNALRRINPQLRVVLSSGFTESEIAPRFAGLGLAGFLQKPYALYDLARCLHRVLNSPLPT
ncbi:MAG TPA: response regulator, partial [Candidatus Competibacteraceae bacterium]|nr:response regulator [Candidatus Competibacteraceae bacterium]